VRAPSAAGRQAAPIADRDLHWDGCFNARDLGGLPAGGGRITRRGALVRADSLAGLTAAGWDALRAHGVRTVVDLRNDDEAAGGDAAPRPDGLATVRVALDGVEDTAFWDVWASGPQFGTPLYYRPFLERAPERTARAVAAIARARPGGVAVHCVGGRDRTGLVAIAVLALLGVAPEHIAADYALSAPRLSARSAALGSADDGPVLEAFLAERGTTAEALVVDLLDAIDVEALLRAGGLTDDDLAALRARALDERAAPEAAAA
jgi:protein-tyrosine phosphatase